MTLSKIPKFRRFVLQNFPFIEEDFDALTDYELLCKVVEYLNNVIDSQNEVTAEFEALSQAFNQLQSYVNNYFDNLDVQEEINNKLDQMAIDGSLTALIGNYVTPIFNEFSEEVNLRIENQNLRITNQDARIDQQDNQIDEIGTRVNSVVGSNPIPVSSTSDMTDTTKIYVLTTNGYWYYHDGDGWVQGGLFQTPQSSSLIEQTTYLRDDSLNNVFDKNMFNEDSNFIKRGMQIIGSTISPTSYTNLCLSHPILVKAGVSYTFYADSSFGTTRVKYAYIDKDYSNPSVYDATLDSENSTATFTAPSDGYVIFNLVWTRRKITIFAKTADYANNLKYGYSNVNLKIDAGNVQNELEFNQLNYYDKSANLFDKDSPLITAGHISGNGYASDVPGLYRSAPIHLRKGDVIKFSHPTALGNNRIFAKCDVLGNYISAIYGEAEDSHVTYTIEDTGYYCFNAGYKTDFDSFMVVRNISFPSEYVAYKSNLYNIHIPYIDNQLEDIETHISPLYSKKLAVTGDSIADAINDGGFGGIIASDYNMTIQNIATSGGTIASGTTGSGGVNRFWINQSISSLNTDADYIIVEGGVNDSSLGVPLGSLTSTYTANLDVETYYGAFENMLKQLITRFAGKKYCYVAVHQMTNNYRYSNDPTTSYYWAAKKCCEKWGVPFCDLNVAVPPFAYFPNGSGDLYALRQTYTKNGDGWHPNEAGYKKYYCNKIAKFMENL